jgi:hypothetical protein
MVMLRHLMLPRASHLLMLPHLTLLAGLATAAAGKNSNLNFIENWGDSEPSRERPIDDLKQVLRPAPDIDPIHGPFTAVRLSYLGPATIGLTFGTPNVTLRQMMPPGSKPASWPEWFVPGMLT